MPTKAWPPPLPQPVLLKDTDLVDDEAAPVRASQPTSVDVEIDCFSRTEPPPESRPRRKRALLALVTSVFVVAAAGLVFSGRLAVLDSGATRAPATLTNGALSPAKTPAPTPKPALVQKPASAAEAPAPASGARPKLTTHAQRGKKKAVSAKKPSKPARTPQALY